MTTMIDVAAQRAAEDLETDRAAAATAACDEAQGWARAHGEGATLEDLYRQCPRGNWLVWGLFRAGVPARDLALAVLPSVMRALRVHAPTALDAAVAAGADPALAAHARRLRALPAEISPRAEEARGALAASDAAAAARAKSAAVAVASAAVAAASAAAAAESAAAADVAAAARTAATAAADAAGWAASDEAGWATSEDAARRAAAATAEHQRCADEIRDAIPWAVVREAAAESAARAEAAAARA
jgi:hypothetical protein